MRKTYIRPEIHSEEFITNEYCSPCYVIETCCGKFVINYEPDYDILGLPDPSDGFYKAYVNGNNLVNGSYSYVYDRTFVSLEGEEKVPDKQITYSTTKVHIVNGKEKITEDKRVPGYGPNHS